MLVPPQPLVSALIALQFVAFGWRINREITVGDAGRKTWLPLPDYLNIASLLAVTVSCVVLPLANRPCLRIALTALSSGYVLIALHPINEAAHYRLFSKYGRSVYKAKARDYPWITDQEIVTVAISAICAATAGWLAYAGFPK